MKTRKLGMLILLIGCALILGWLLSPRQPSYAGRSMSQCVEDGILGNPYAWSVLLHNEPPDAATLRKIEAEVLSCSAKLLKTKDNRLWKPYTIMRTNLPLALAARLPQWREPKQVRFAAARWLSSGIGSKGEALVPTLCESISNDPDAQLRRLCILTLSHIQIENESNRAAVEGTLARVAEKDSDPFLRESALSFLRRFDSIQTRERDSRSTLTFP